ncbi:MAG: NAD-dependent isocitrate dehydrogenase, partial [Rhodobacterales bacterium]|nr:NAD-dependent isocitrate dehydrogenase [Rhodobacterales bacterium]
NVGDRVAVFEAVHGTAPDIAGKGIANPLAVILSSLLMLDWMGETKISAKIRTAIHRVLNEAKHITGDLGGKAGTAEFTQAIIDVL